MLALIATNRKFLIILFILIKQIVLEREKDKVDLKFDLK